MGVVKGVMDNLMGISESNRRYLTQLHRHTNGLVDVDEAGRLLGLDSIQAAKLLAHWARQGWTRRLRRGLYLLVPLEATSPEDWSEDAWLVADRVFRPGYIAGWSAAEHWGFTEQLFQDVAVFTAAPIRVRQITIDQTNFVLHKIPERLLFGTRPVWRKGTPVQVSDPTHTVVDMLDNPKWGGGMRHIAQMISAYMTSEYKDEALLLNYLERVGNAAASKRLGYLLEARMDSHSSLIERLRPFITAGYTRLDPTVPPCGPHLSQWNVQINVEIGQ